VAGQGVADRVTVARGGEPVLIVDEWHVRGDPTVVIERNGETLEQAFPPYHFVYRSDDSRWCGTAAKQAAREFVERCFSDPAKRWRDGPHLFHRTVTYSEFAPVPVEQETPE
jgi:hypothetical protein